jgi:hypothetical protein
LQAPAASEVTVMTMPHASKPLDDLTYDIVSILHEKSQALAAYDDYLQDAQTDPEVAKLIDDIRRHDEEDVHRLRLELGRRLGARPQQEEAPAGDEVGAI